MNAYHNSLLSNLNTNEKRILQYFSPFQNIINFAEQIVSEYITVLRNEDIDCPSYEEVESLYQKCVDSGIFKRLDQFPDTLVVRVQPILFSQLKLKDSDSKDTNVNTQIESAFINYYIWLSDQLYLMYFHTDARERNQNIAFLACEYENLLYALKLCLKYSRYDFTEIFLTINTYLEAKQKYTEKLQLAFSIKHILEAESNRNYDINFHFSVVDIYDAIGTTYFEMMLYDKAETYFKLAFSKYEEFELEKEFPQAKRKLYQNLAVVSNRQNKWKESNKYYKMMLNAAKNNEDHEGIAEYHLHIGKNLLDLAQSDEAIIHLEDAANAFNAMEIKEWEAKAFVYIANAYRGQANYNDAERYYDKALDLFELIDDQSFLADVYSDLSIFYSAKHEFLKGMEYADKSIKIFIDIGDVRKEALSYVNFCSAALGMEEIPHCENYLKKAYTIFSNIDDNHHLNLVIQLATFLDEKLDTSILNDILENTNHFLHER